MLVYKKKSYYMEVLIKVIIFFFDENALLTHDLYHFIYNSSIEIS